MSKRCFFASSIATDPSAASSASSLKRLACSTLRMTERTVEESSTIKTRLGNRARMQRSIRSARLLHVDRLGERAVDLQAVGQNLAGLHRRRADQNGQRTAGRGADGVEQFCRPGLEIRESKNTTS